MQVVIYDCISVSSTCKALLKKTCFSVTNQVNPTFHDDTIDFEGDKGTIHVNNWATNGGIEVKLKHYEDHKNKIVQMTTLDAYPAGAHGLPFHSHSSGFFSTGDDACNTT